MNIYTIADLLTGMIEAFLMFMLLESFCKKRNNFPGWAYGLGAIILGVMINLSNHIFSYGMLNIVGMLLSFFIMSFFYKSSLPIRGILSILNLLMLMMTELFVMYSITSIYNISVIDAIEIPIYRLLGIIVSKMLAILVINIIRTIFKGRKFYTTPTYWIIFLFMFLTTTATMFLVFKLSYDIKDEHIYNLSILCSFGMLFSSFFIFNLYERLAKQAEEIKEQHQYEQHLKGQLKHLDDILITQNQFKKFKHDFSHYVIGLQAYLEKNDCHGALNHIKDLKNMFNSGKDIVETGNIALDAILSTKKALAESKNICFATKIQIPEKLSVESVDMCIIFGNALDNAIEACERVKNADKKISLTIICQDETVFCKITNTSSPESKSVFKTAKNDKTNHGYGLENIKNALAKYNCTPTIEHTENEYTLKFILFTKE